VLEGGLMEARLGNIEAARTVLTFLMTTVGTYGTIYLEAVRFEEKWGRNLYSALNYSEESLAKNARYGPLWFCYLRIIDKLSLLGVDMTEKRESAIQRASNNLSKELVWKLFLESSISYERLRNWSYCRAFLNESALHCPENLRWKVWMAGARLELRNANLRATKALIQKCLSEVPAKQKPLVNVE
jgi:la-related protein 1